MTKLRAVLLAVGVLVALFAGWRMLSGPKIPEGFQALAERFQSADTVQIDLLWPQPGSSRQAFTALRWNRSGKAAADVMEGPQGRLTLINGMVKLATAEIQLPIPALSEPGEALYQEILTGFANSEWRSMPPPARGVFPPRTDREWVGITLPFDWARDHELQLGISKETGELTTVVVESRRKSDVSVSFQQFRAGTRNVKISDGPQLWLVIEDVRWDQPISADDFDPKKHP